MSRIGDLIAEYCPDGVEFKTLGDVGEFIRGNGLQKKDFVEVGFPCIHYGQVFTTYGTATSTTRSFVTPELAMRLRRAKPGDLIIATTSENDEDVCKGVAWLGDTEVAISGDSYIYSHSLDPLYAAYLLQTDDFRSQKARFITGTKLKRVSGAHLARIRIPVPPPAVQREIAETLSSMQTLKAELEAELEAELHLRSRQRSLYWNQLLTPDETWRKTTIGEIAEVFDGPHATPRKTDSGPWYLSISSLSGGRFDLSRSVRLDADQYDQWTRRVAARVGDTMFSYETRLGQAAFWERDEPAALGRRMGVLRPRESEVFPRFLTLAYLGPEFQSLIRSRTVRGATVERIPIADMARWEISIPPIPEQKRIVKVLDKFDTLVNDLLVGLPAEIAARRKQYEYYRDKLLTFGEAA